MPGCDCALLSSLHKHPHQNSALQEENQVVRRKSHSQSVQALPRGQKTQQEGRHHGVQQRVRVRADRAGAFSHIVRLSLGLPPRHDPHRAVSTLLVLQIRQEVRLVSGRESFQRVQHILLDRAPSLLHCTLDIGEDYGKCQ